HLHVRQRRDLDVALEVVDCSRAGQTVRAFHVHRARSANALRTRAAEGQRRVDLILDLDQCVEDHRTAFVEVDGVAVEARVGAAVRVVAGDLEGPEPFAFLGLPGVAFLDLAVLGKREFSQEETPSWAEPLARAGLQRKGRPLARAAPGRGPY